MSGSPALTDCVPGFAASDTYEIFGHGIGKLIALTVR